MPTSYINLHTSSLDIHYANRVPYEVSGLVYWLDPQRWNDPAAPWTLNGTKVVAAPSRESSSGVIDATKTATQGTDAQRPTLNTSDANYGGRATLSFSSAAAQYLVSGAWASSQAQPTTVYVVGHSTGTAAQRTLVDGIGGSNLHRIATAITTGYTTISAGNAVADTTNAADSEPRVWCALFNGVSSAIYVNGEAVASATGNALTQTITGITVGANQALGSTHNGKIATVLVYSGAHDQATRTRIMQWLSDRYGFDRSLTPYTVGGLAYWLDPDRYADVSGPGAWTMNGTKVATAVSRHSWARVADTSKNVTQGTDAQRPTLNVADANFGGRGTITFTKAASQLLVSGAWTTALVQPITTYIVAVHADVAAINTMMDGIAAGNRILFQNTGAADGRPAFYAGTGFITAAGKTTLTQAVYCLVGNGASSATYMNDSTTAVATGNPGTTGLTGITLGAYYNGANTNSGRIATVIVYSGAHTAAQRALIMQWLGARYGVVVT